MEKVLVAMSGGVDSSVAAALLVEAGYEVIGVTMQLWDYSKNETTDVNPNNKFDTCCSLDDVADARMVAHKLNIPFYVFDYQEDFQENVVDYFRTEYLRGRTPNPCTACNTFLKFDHLLERAERLGCKFIATGHYAQILRHEKSDLYQLYKARDLQKDQSYFLYSLTQERLAKILFPIGHLLKTEVRELAQRYNLVNAKKSESMEICFIPNNDYAKFIAMHTAEKDLIKGFIYHENGKLLSPHDGIHQFTVGQRKGLKISAELPLYVTRIDANTGTVYVGEEEYLYRSGCTIKKINLLLHNKPECFDVDVKIRYRSPAVKATIKIDNQDAKLIFHDRQKAVTPGQIAVLYIADELIGGGIIDESFI